jgi:amino acid transporter
MTDVKRDDVALGEKGVVGSDHSPAYDGNHHGDVAPGDYDEFTNNTDFNSMSFWGRMGFTKESFQPRTETEKNRHNRLNQNMKGRHLHMIAIGGSIGAGLFVGTGGALNRGGPMGLILCYMIIGVMMFNVVFALGEMAMMYPVSGGFYVLVTRFVDPSWGFAMGWNYFLQWLFILPFEILVASFTIKYWNTEVHPAVWMTVFLIGLTIITCFGTLGYAEEEFWSSALKLTAIVTFIFIGLICVCGGGPSSGDFSEPVGTRIFMEEGGFRNGFKGFVSCFVTAAFAFAGTELVGLAAAETKTPLRSLPSACKQVFWRIILFYILSLLFVGLLISATDKDMLGGETAYIDANASPFVLVGKRAGLNGYDHFINAVVMLSVVSIGISGIYGGSRTLTAMAEQGYAPKLFAYVDRAGRPLYSNILILIIGGVAYAGADEVTGPELFDWLLGLSGLAALFTWGSICFAHIRFRAAWKRQGHTLEEIPFRHAAGVYGSWVGFALSILVFIASIYSGLYPPGPDAGLNDAKGFFKSCLAFPVVIFFWICGYIWKRPKFLTLNNIDVDTGRREIDWEMHREIQEKRARANPLMKVVYLLF